MNWFRFVVVSGALTAAGLPSTHAAEDNGPSLQEVTITGTRIRQQTGMTTPVPVTSLSTSDLASLNPGASIADQLDRLPQLFQTESAQRSSGALFGNAGGTYLNLRGLESQTHAGAARRLARRAGRPRRHGERRRISDGAHQERRHRDGRRLGPVRRGCRGRRRQLHPRPGFRGAESHRLHRQTGAQWRRLQPQVRPRGRHEARREAARRGVLDYNRIDQIQRDPTQLGDWFQRYGLRHQSGVALGDAHAGRAAAADAAERDLVGALALRPHRYGLQRAGAEHRARHDDRAELQLPQLCVHARRHGRAAVHTGRHHRQAPAARSRCRADRSSTRPRARSKAARSAPK